VDGFGVGSALVVSSDAPSLGGVYKLVELENGRNKSYHAKFSAEKATYPATKQIYRFRDPSGMFAHDLIACSGERVQAGEALLEPVMRQGRRVIPQAESLGKIRDRVRRQLERLPDRIRRLKEPAKYEVRFSDELERLLETVRREHLS
jgi:nicotinate phosphoribosyltransferase